MRRESFSIVIIEAVHEEVLAGVVNTSIYFKEHKI